MNIIYLQKSLSINGRSSFYGRKLFDLYRNESDECLLGHIIVPNEFYASAKDEAYRRDLVSYDMLRDLEPDLLYIEGGMLASKSMWKIPKEITTDLVSNGTVMLINDVDINDVTGHFDAMQDVLKHFAARVLMKNNSPVYAAGRGCSPAELHLSPDKMIISEWLRPVYSDVSSLIVSWAMRLNFSGDILATANYGEHGTLASDLWVDETDCCPFATVQQVGNGYIVLVAGVTTPWAERHEGTQRWLMNISRFLCNAAHSNKDRTISHRHSNDSLFLSHRSTDKTIVDKVSTEIKKAGVGVWYDKDKMLPSDSLVAKINEGLLQMTHFVLFWSSSCLHSNWVDRELNAAISRLIENNTPIIIVRLDRTPLPALIADLYRLEAESSEPTEIAQSVITTVKKLRQRGYNQRVHIVSPKSGE